MNAVLAASIFHFGTFTVGDVKKFLAEKIFLSGCNWPSLEHVGDDVRSLKLVFRQRRNL